MKWIDLELSKIADIEKQSAEVIRTYETLTKQQQQPKKGVNVAQVTQAIRVLKSAMVSRVLALEAFYKEHDLDSRAARFETTRLKLKRALKEGGMTPQEFATIAQAAEARRTAAAGGESLAGASTPTMSSASALGRTHSQREVAAALNSHKLTPGADGQPACTLRVHMTPAEFEELRARRQAIRTVRRGQGSMAWESAATARTPRADPGGQGMFTYHEVPYSEGGPTTPRAKAGGGMRFGASSTSSPQHPASDIHRGVPYVSTNPEVFSRTARFPTAHDEWHGGAKAVNPAAPFNAVTPRTSVTSAQSRA
eukprot:CAMPEP_0174839224 /NCGR_PEP_ID=MMETSP1114-20130205/7902_1 /TAXON_ID=312471 /ORGANISM="Neobodo designis, Strain CCAP 1951/1" /LENGTH=309 /DNA_ID=CAMNT_0016073345 /DNA_START=83 /DNA_END=1008 /DNA_ORIENTATION=+